MLDSRAFWLPLACLIVCATLYDVTSALDVDPVQKEILYRIRSETPALEMHSTQPWTNASIDDVCNSFNIYGVTACNNTGWVTTLSFDSGYSLGTMAPSFGDMEGMQLFYAHSTFSGPLLPSIGNWAQLESIDFSMNSDISGPIPDEWKTLKLLSAFRWNGAIGEVSMPDWIGDEWPALRLFFWKNLLTSGPFPAWIEGRLDLEIINLAHNQFSGEVPATLTSMTALSWLDLSFNHFNGSFPSDWSASASLNVISLDSNEFSGDLPALLSPFINTLTVSENSFSGSIPDSWMDSFLRTLDVSGNELSGEIPWSSITSDSRLNTFIVSGNSELEGSLPSSLWDLPTLSSFYFSDTRISGPLPDTMSPDCRLADIRASNTPIGGPLPSHLDWCTSLTNFHIINAGISGMLPNTISNTTSLRSIKLDNNDLEGPLLEDWSLLTRLSALSLSGNRFSGTVPQSLTDLTAANGLLELYLDNNELDLCGNLLLDEESVHPHLTCNVSAQLTQACGCGNIWDQCLDPDMPACPIIPLESTIPITPETTIIPDPAEPSSPPSPSSPNPAASTPSAPTDTSSASLALPSLLLASAGYILVFATF